jgi:hypothetical protein
MDEGSLRSLFVGAYAVMNAVDMAVSAKLSIAMLLISVGLLWQKSYSGVAELDKVWAWLVPLH